MLVTARLAANLAPIVTVGIAVLYHSPRTAILLPCEAPELAELTRSSTRFVAASLPTPILALMVLLALSMMAWCSSEESVIFSSYILWMLSVKPRAVA